MGESCQHMKMETINVLRFLSSETIFNIPNYQPAYAWSAEQCKQLFFDLENNWKNKTTTCLGMIVYNEEVNKSIYTYNITDHRQIVLNCMLLLKALADVYPNLKDEIKQRYLFNPYLKDLKLKTVTQDKHDFGLIMNNQMNHVEAASLLLKNFKKFSKLIVESVLNGQEIYDSLVNMNIITIILDEYENPQWFLDNIHQTNDNLDDADKILNFILMNTNEDQKEQFYINNWLEIKKMVDKQEMSMVDFLKEYLTSKNAVEVKKDKVYSTYRYYFKCHNLTPKMAFEDLYSVVTSCKNSSRALRPGEYWITTKMQVKGHKLIEFRIKNHNYVLKKWNEALVKLLNYAIEIDQLMLVKKYAKLNAKLFINDPNNKKTLSNGEIIETNFPAQRILSYMQIIAKIYHISDSVTFRIEIPQSLLDTINLTSYNLDDADKVLNFILKHAKENEKDYLHRDYWLKIKELVSNRYPSMMDFLRDYLELKSGNSIDKYKISSSYHYYYKVNNLTPKTALEDLYDIALNNDVLVEEKAKRKYEYKDHSDNVLSPNEHYITENIDVTAYEITQLNVDSKRIYVNYWNDALSKLLDNLFEMDTNNRRLIEQNKKLNEKIFRQHKNKHTKRLANGEYIYKNISANEALLRMKEVSKACHMDDVVTFKIIPKDKLK
jgi:hypothetical protein